MLRIAHVCLRYPPATGGAETYVREIVERTRLRQGLPVGRQGYGGQGTLRYDVRVLTSKLRTHGPVSELTPELLLDDPMYVQRLHHRTTPGLSYPRLQALSYYLRHHNPDIVHGYSFWYQPADVAARYAHKHRRPFIFHPIYYSHGRRHSFKWQAYKHLIGRRTFAAADIVAVISPYEQKLIEKEGFRIKRFELIPPGVDTTQFAVQRKNPFASRGISGRVLLTVSRLAPGKGLEELLEIFPILVRQHHDVQLVIIGEDFGLEPMLRARAEQGGVSRNIHFLGKLPAEELVAAYQHASLFVHPSEYEAFGIVLAEALAAGTPVVARDTAAIPYVVPPEKAGLLFSTRAELQQHLTTLLGNASLARSLAEFGKLHVQRQFSWNAIIPRLLSLYDELNSQKAKR